MSKDYHKREAKRSLWDLDGQHCPKRYRNKGKARGKDKELIRAELPLEDREFEIMEQVNEEANDAYYCHFYGPCAECRAKGRI